MPPAKEPRPSAIWRFWPYLALAALAFGVYAGALNNGFVTDDFPQLVNNPVITSLRGLPDIFGHDVRTAHPEQPSNYYRPLSFVAYLAIHLAAGPDPFAFHLIMILLHVANTLMLYRVTLHFAQHATPVFTRPAAIFAAALFAVHPIHSEAILWIAVMADLMVTLFGLCMFDLWIRQQASPRGWQILPYAALFFAALLTKEPAVMLLPLLAAYAWLVCGQSLLDMWKNRAFYATLLAAFAIYLAMRLHAIGGLAPGQENRFHLRGWELAINVIALPGQYLLKLIAPFPLRYHYEFTPLHSLSIGVILSFLSIVALAAGVWMARRKAPLVSFALLWIILPLLPTMNIIGVGETVFSERYLYIPSIGFVWIAGILWMMLARKQQMIAWGAAAIILGAASYEVIERNPEFRDELALFTVTVRQNPQSPSMIASMASVHQQLGQFDKATEEYRQANQLRPGDAAILGNLAGVLVQAGRNEEAIEQARKAIAIDPKFPAAYVNLGIALDATGKSDEAAASIEKALQLRPDYPDALNALALNKKKAKDYPAAIALFQRVVAAKPLYTEAYFNLGVTYSVAGDYKNAAEAFRGALKVGERSSFLYLIHYGLGVCYINLNSPEAAQSEFMETLRLRPGDARAQESLRTVQGMLAGRK